MIRLSICPPAYRTTGWKHPGRAIPFISLWLASSLPSSSSLHHFSTSLTSSFQVWLSRFREVARLSPQPAWLQIAICLNKELNSLAGGLKEPLPCDGATYCLVFWKYGLWFQEIFLGRRSCWRDFRVNSRCISTMMAVEGWSEFWLCSRVRRLGSGKQILFSVAAEDLEKFS